MPAGFLGPRGIFSVVAELDRPRGEAARQTREKSWRGVGNASPSARLPIGSKSLRVRLPILSPDMLTSPSSAQAWHRLTRTLLLVF
jgi:hypothetical protein